MRHCLACFPSFPGKPQPCTRPRPQAFPLCRPSPSDPDFSSSGSVTPTTVGILSTCFPSADSHLFYPPHCLSHCYSGLLSLRMQSITVCGFFSVHRLSYTPPVCCGDYSTHSFPSTLPFLPQAEDPVCVAGSQRAVHSPHQCPDVCCPFCGLKGSLPIKIPGTRNAGAPKLSRLRWLEISNVLGDEKMGRWGAPQSWGLLPLVPRFCGRRSFRPPLAS